MEHLTFEVGLAVALVAMAGVLSATLRFSIVPPLGMVDLRFIHSAPLIAFMGRIGLLVLLFYLGLEFSVGRLLKAGRSIAVGGTIYTRC